MKRRSEILAKCFLLFSFLTALYSTTMAQSGSMTYVVDESFDSGMLVGGNAGVGTILPYMEGRLLLAGSFDGAGSPVNSLCMIESDGSLYAQWFIWTGPTSITDIVVQDDGILETTIVSMGKVTLNGEPWQYAHGHNWRDNLFSGSQSPYQVENAWSLYSQPDDRVLMGGAFAVDSLQPDFLRNLIRFMPDGTLDTSFPIISVQPNDWTSRIATIDQISDGKWIISGRFYSVNDHETAFIARLNSDFTVDTTFVSPLEFVFTFMEPNIVMIDSQERLWVSGRYVVAQNQPDDTLNIVRILPSGALDSSFNVSRVEVNYPPGSLNIGSTIAMLYGGVEIEGSNHYLLHGRFNYWNDTLQSNITVVDDAGYIQANYFQGDGATEHQVNLAGTLQVPMVAAVAALPDGSLIVGGEFSTFMGVTRQNLIKLNPSTIGIYDQSFDHSISIHPNPANNWFVIKRDKVDEATIIVYDLSGRAIFRTDWRSNSIRVNTESFGPGFYLVEIRTNQNKITKKLVVK